MSASEPAATPLASEAIGRTHAQVRALLLRHGQSEWNAIRRWQGGADSPLTALGRTQAIESAWQLAGLGGSFVSLWSSDLSRASETASIIGDALALGPPRLDPRLREAHAGEWEGLTPDEIEAGWPGWLVAHRRPPTFESFDGVVGRAVAALRDIAAHADGIAGSHTGDAPHVLIVTHSGVIRSLIRHLGRHDDRVPNLGGVWLSVTASLASGPCSTTTGLAEVELSDVFDPHGVVVSGVDAPGEDPGEQADQAEADRSPQH